jgi:biopolymer transport protein ExbD
MLPLIDIVFLLLVFFIYAMLSMAVHHGKTVDLPVSGTASLNTQDAISLTILDMGDQVSVFLNGEPLPVNQLTERLLLLKQEFQHGKKSEVEIFADKSVSYQELFAVMDTVQAAGLTQISLQAELHDPQP